MPAVLSLVRMSSLTIPRESYVRHEICGLQIRQTKGFQLDNGAAYKNRQMELLAARIGSVISYCRPYTPTQKAKSRDGSVPLRINGWHPWI